ncbi:MAG: putative photosynthetic complex assembly protein PuhE [Pseudomonadota bacterium]
MSNPWIAGLVAVFVWWFSTGAILLVVKRADQLGLRARKQAVLMGLPLLVLGIWGYMATLATVSVAASYLAFLAVLAIWGWIELAFLAGIISGPIRKPCPPNAPEWERFLRAWGTIAFHEILLVGMVIAIGLYGWGAENTFGMWTFFILFFARISAKLNLFLGVPKINTEFLPSVLEHLPSHFRIRRLNWLFPISITALTFAVACWLERLWVAPSAGDVVGFSLLGAITTLALLEHWLMVLPVPDERLWRWMLPVENGRPNNTSLIKTTREDAHGL